MRTTLTLDEDVAAKLKSEARRSGRPLREIVNEILRRGLGEARESPNNKPFKVRPRNMGRMRAGLSSDGIADLVEQIEGPLAR